VKRDTWSIEDLNLTRRSLGVANQATALVRGFFRDAQGQFRPLTYNQNK
jgi:hypothetical protein